MPFYRAVDAISYSPSTPGHAIELQAARQAGLCIFRAEVEKLKTCPHRPPLIAEDEAAAATAHCPVTKTKLEALAGVALMAQRNPEPGLKHVGGDRD